MQNNKYTDPPLIGNDIDILDILSRLWKNRLFIVKWAAIGALVGLVIAFSIPKTYKAGVTFAPETQQKVGSGVSSIASMMGVSLNNSVDAISVEMFPDVVHSSPFVVELFDLPIQFEHNGSTINTTFVDYMQNYQKKPWWSYVFGFPFKVLGWCMDIITPGDQQEPGDKIETRDYDPSNLTKKQRSVVNYFYENLKVSTDKKSGKTTMSLTMQDPLVVAEVMEAVVENLKKYMSDYRTSKARQDVENLSLICEERKNDYYKAQQAYANYMDANQNVVRLSAQAERERLQQEMNIAYQVYSQVASQLEGARIQVQQAKPVFVIIEPVSIPIRKSAPSKGKFLVIFAFLACCCSTLWVLWGEELLTQFREKL